MQHGTNPIQRVPANPAGALCRRGTVPLLVQGDDFPARPSCDARDDQRQLACLKQMFNVARKGLIVLKGGIPLTNPAGSVTLEHENNVRDRVLSHEDTKMPHGRAISLTKELT